MKNKAMRPERDASSCGTARVVLVFLVKILAKLSDKRTDVRISFLA